MAKHSTGPLPLLSPILIEAAGKFRQKFDWTETTFSINLHVTEKELLLDMKRRDKLYDRAIEIEELIIHSNNQAVMRRSISVSACVLFTLDVFCFFFHFIWLVIHQW